MVSGYQKIQETCRLKSIQVQEKIGINFILDPARPAIGFELSSCLLLEMSRSGHGGGSAIALDPTKRGPPFKRAKRAQEKNPTQSLREPNVELKKHPDFDQRQRQLRHRPIIQSESPMPMLDG